MKKYTKKDVPVDKVRRFLARGPVVLVSSAYNGERDIFAMGWHLILMDEPSRTIIVITTNLCGAIELYRKTRTLLIEPNDPSQD